MGDGRRASCKVCGRHRDEVGILSWEGFCGECGPAVRNIANDHMHYHTGYYFQRWRRGMAASVGAVLLDDQEAAR